MIFASQPGIVPRAQNSKARNMARPPTHRPTALTPEKRDEIDRIFDIAQQYHAAGRLSEAERGYLAILKEIPDHAPALHFLGVTAMAAGKLKAAIDFIERAIRAKPDYVEAHSNLGNALQQRGRVDHAIKSYRKAIKFDPGYAVAHMNLGATLLQHGDAAGAVQCLEKAIEIEPDYAAAHRNLGGALKELGQSDRAVAAYEKYLSVHPQDAEAVNNLGVVLEARGRLSEAVTQFRKAASLPPEEAGPYLNLGRTLEAMGDAEGALVNYRKAVSVSPDYVAAHYGCGNVLTKLGRPDDAAEAYRTALDLEPAHRDARLAYDALRTRKVSFWHFPMMNDTARNDAFEGALKAAITPESRVLDIGSGSGLLALMAARAGAARVDTVEVVTPIAEVAQKIIGTNGFGETVTVHNKLSTAMEIGPDLPAKADILVTETFDVGVLGEHVVSTIRHARANLLTEDAIIIPQRAEVIGALFESEEIYKRAKVRTVSGFDLSDFNTFKKPYHQLTVSNFPHRMISDPFTIFDFDFTGDPILPESRPQTIQGTEGAVCHGVVFWFRLMLDRSHVYDTGPTSNPGNHWEQAVHILNTPVQIPPGGAMPVTAHHNNRMISFSFEPE